jgi:hypothetical protein
VCTYDRANVGRSDPAPTPRTSDDVVADLRALLAAAPVDGPYVLAGNSAGGTFVMHFARAYPDDVVGVLASNPVPLASDWIERAYPLLTEAQIEDEESYYDGENDEHFAWTTSHEQYEALPIPDDVPLVLLHSDATQCEGEVDDPCARTADLYLTLGLEYADEWPGARFEAVAMTHGIPYSHPETYEEVIEGFLADA